MVLPFTPLTVVFQDVQYYVDTPLEMREHGFTNKKLQILSDITGALRPGVLTALMGVSGAAGKTTLLDVLAGRKTSGYIEGQIKIGGYPKEFVNEVLETIEIDGIKDALVGIPGVTGLSNEQRKRLTIAVELVANPSIIFMDEPTTGLDARAAAIVMRAVKNVVDTGRTILIILKTGGHLIYSRTTGTAFKSIPGVQKIRNNYNPATWMLEVTSTSAEAELGVDFALKYRESALYE
uniref:ABC transporter domain-containing protein n=1 Tax=Fagus sylvatica TaxID=28930 RepID=A0A2N9GKW4_FAGSY